MRTFRIRRQDLNFRAYLLSLVLALSFYPVYYGHFFYGIGSLIRIRIGILLFFALDFKMPTKTKFFQFFFYVSGTICTLTSVFKDNVSMRSHKTVEIMVYLNFLCLLIKGDPDRIRTNNYGSGSQRLTNIRIPRNWEILAIVCKF